jgi:hypothetical protein
MRSIICLAIFYCVLFPVIAMSLESKGYDIYYLSLESDFYMPPTRDYIIKYGAPFKTYSTTIADLFADVSKQKGIHAQETDYEKLRILIIDKHGDRELYITVDKTALFQNKKYYFEPQYMNKLLTLIVEGAKRKEMQASNPAERIPITQEKLNLPTPPSK